MAAKDLGLDPPRDPPAQSDRARRDAVPAGEGASERWLRRDAMRQRRLCQHASIIASPKPAGAKSAAERQADRWPLSRPRRRLLHRGRRVGPARECAHRGRAGGIARLRRLVGDRAGDRDDHGADRRRRARVADRDPRAPRLDELSCGKASALTVRARRSWAEARIVAAQTLLEKFRAAAAKQLGVPPDPLTIAEGLATRARRPPSDAGRTRGLNADGKFRQFQGDLHLRHRGRACRGRCRTPATSRSSTMWWSTTSAASSTR